MLFNSYVFILLFLPASLLGYFLLNRWKKPAWAKAFLLLMSLWFYGYFNYSYLLILILSIVVNYMLKTCLLDREALPLRRLGFGLGLGLNIGVLFVFKYYDFFVGNVNALFSSNLPLLHLLLPLGISFFTFQQLSFIIDAWRQKVPDYSFLDYALFVAFFPQLIAGPIVRHNQTIPQFNDPQKQHFSYDNFGKGLYGFALGLGKKVLIADMLGRLVDQVYGNIASALPGDAILAIFCYTMQIYFDFSGYCDMAVGIGHMFNIGIPQNFDSPYRSLNVAEFWRRWHMTLTSFFTEYIYIPLGGNRKGKARTMCNVMIVFAVSGLWHGANWTFIVWGVLHGAGVVISRLAGRPKKRFWQAVSWALTFLFLNAAWVVFRANSLDQAGQIFAAVGRLFSTGGNLFTESVKNVLVIPQLSDVLSGLPKYEFIMMAFWIALTVYFSIFSKNAFRRMEDFRPRAVTAVVSAALILVCVLSLSQVSTFLYFNF